MGRCLFPFPAVVTDSYAEDGLKTLEINDRLSQGWFSYKPGVCYTSFLEHGCLFVMAFPFFMVMMNVIFGQ